MLEDKLHPASPRLILQVPSGCFFFSNRHFRRFLLSKSGTAKPLTLQGFDVVTLKPKVSRVSIFLQVPSGCLPPGIFRILRF